MTTAPTARTDTTDPQPDDSHRWIALFSAHLMASDDRVSFGYAIDCAVRSFELSAQVTPQAGAELFALVHFPENLGRRWRH